MAVTHSARRIGAHARHVAGRLQPGEPRDLQLGHPNGLLELAVVLARWGRRRVRPRPRSRCPPAARAPSSPGRSTTAMTRCSSRNSGASRSASGSIPKGKPEGCPWQPAYDVLTLRWRPCPPPTDSSCVSRPSPSPSTKRSRSSADPSAGGTCVFVGTVRDHGQRGDVTGLTYEAWDELARDPARRDRRRALPGMAGRAKVASAASHGAPRHRRGERRGRRLVSPPRRSVRCLPAWDRTAEGRRADLEEGVARRRATPTG